MSEFLVKMDTPNRCYDCPMCYEYFFCRLAEKEFGEIECVEIVADWCPLVELPPHGRLGDLDKLEKMFADIDSAPYSCFDGAEPFYSAEDAAQIIRLAPTVIPASGEGET